MSSIDALAQAFLTWGQQIDSLNNTISNATALTMPSATFSTANIGTATITSLQIADVTYVFHAPSYPFNTGSGVGTLNNVPTAGGDPIVWLKVTIGAGVFFIPAWG